MPLQNPPWDLSTAEGRRGARAAQLAQWTAYAEHKALTMNHTPVCAGKAHELCEASVWECLCRCHDPEEVKSGG